MRQARTGPHVFHSGVFFASILFRYTGAGFCWHSGFRCRMFNGGGRRLAVQQCALSDDQWARIAPLLPGEASERSGASNTVAGSPPDMAGPPATTPPSSPSRQPHYGRNRCQRNIAWIKMLHGRSYGIFFETAGASVTKHQSATRMIGHRQVRVRPASYAGSGMESGVRRLRA